MAGEGTPAVTVTNRDECTAATHEARRARRLAALVEMAAGNRASAAEAIAGLPRSARLPEDATITTALVDTLQRAVDALELQ